MIRPLIEPNPSWSLDSHRKLSDPLELMLFSSYERPLIASSLQIQRGLLSSTQRSRNWSPGIVSQAGDRFVPSSPKISTITTE